MFGFVARVCSMMERTWAYEKRPPELFVITELDLRLTDAPPEGEPHPERTPVGPFATRDEANDWALNLVKDHGGNGFWQIVPLRSPEG
jgi:hypothetical protein